MTTVYTFAEDIGPQQWRALPREFKKGESVFRYSGYDYGCARDDYRYGDTHSITCCEKEGKTPFFTVPVTALRLPDGTRPLGPYEMGGR